MGTWDIWFTVSRTQHRVARYLVRECEEVNLNVLDKETNGKEDNGLKKKKKKKKKVMQGM